MEALHQDASYQDAAEIQSNVEQEIREQAFARVGFELGFHDIDTAVQKYLSFCSLPENYTKSISYPYFNSKEDSQAGYFVKGNNPDKPDEDRKAIFHFRDRLPDRLKYGGVEIAPQLDEFLQAAKAIHEAACQTLYESMSDVRAG